MMFTNVDPCDPARAEEHNWSTPAFPHVRTTKETEKWKGGDKFEMLTHTFTAQAALMHLEDHVRIAKNHVKRHVAQAVTDAEQQNKAARDHTLTMLDLHRARLGKPAKRLPRKEFQMRTMLLNQRCINRMQSKRCCVTRAMCATIKQ